MTHPANPGEEKAWELLAAMNPAEVCRSAAVGYDAATGVYRIRSYGMDIDVSARDRTISSNARGSEALLKRLSYFFRLSVLWYLVNARDAPFTGTLVKLQTIKGGDIFTKGSHTLPLQPLAEKYGRNKQTFIEKGKSLGGVPEKLGDAAVRLYPLPRVPLVLALWLEDEEFPAQADLMFDSSCEMQIPLDMIWSVAMMSALIML